MTHYNIREKELRKIIRTIWETCPYGEPTWIEPNFGSGVGFPDVILSISNSEEIPVELKYWPCTIKGIKSSVRPAQIRWHLKEFLQNKKTALLAISPVQPLRDDPWQLFLVRGRCVPVRHYPKIPEHLHLPVGWRKIAVFDWRKRFNEITWDLICNNLGDDEFWTENLELEVNPFERG